jgi:hypothetical protein
MALTTTNEEGAFWTMNDEGKFWFLLGGTVFTFLGLVDVGISLLLLGKGFFKPPWLLTLGAGLVGAAISVVLWIIPMVGHAAGIAIAYVIVDLTLAGKSRGKQARLQEQCKNCGNRLTVDDKMRNRGTGLCWKCFLAFPEA